jgi:rRNA-processing protein FCF1
MQDLARSDDFRVRISAALVLGRDHPAGARQALERALDDGHPAVRVAVAEALERLGDPTVQLPLERRLAGETSQSVRAQIRGAIHRIRLAAALGDDSLKARRLGPNVRCVLAIGRMRNGSGVRGDDLGGVLSEAARTRARAIDGMTVVRDEAPLLRQAAERHVPVITLDGSVTELSEAHVGGGIRVHAVIEFTVRRDQTLRGTVSGSATTFGAGPRLSDDARRRLQDDAVDGAVQSALRGAEQGLIVANL